MARDGHVKGRSAPDSDLALENRHGAASGFFDLGIAPDSRGRSKLRIFGVDIKNSGITRHLAAVGDGLKPLRKPVERANLSICSSIAPAKMYGEGEWPQRSTAIDPAGVGGNSISRDLCNAMRLSAVEMTSDDVASHGGADLLDQNGGSVRVGTGDGAYDDEV